MFGILKKYSNLDRFLSYLGLCYFFAFFSFYVEFPSLFGRDGLVPIEDYHAQQMPKRKSFMEMPNLLTKLLPPGKKSRRFFPFGHSLSDEHFVSLGEIFGLERVEFFRDTIQLCMADLCEIAGLLGVFLSLLLFLLPRKPIKYLAVPLCWQLYLSIFLSSQLFLTFQWDILLLEVGFLANFYLLSSKPHYHMCVDWLFRALFVKLMFMTGYVKQTSGCSTWRSLTALEYHYVSQCIPTEFAWLAHQAPPFLNRLGVAVMFAAQLPPGIFMIFFPDWSHFLVDWFNMGPAIRSLVSILPIFNLRWIAVWLHIVLQIAIALTGNYNWFNVLSLVLLFPCVGTANHIYVSTVAVEKTSEESGKIKNYDYNMPLPMRATFFALSCLIWVCGISYLINSANDILILDSEVPTKSVKNLIAETSSVPGSIAEAAASASVGGGAVGITGGILSAVAKPIAKFATSLMSKDWIGIQSMVMIRDIESWRDWFMGTGMCIVQILLIITCLQYILVTGMETITGIITVGIVDEELESEAESPSNKKKKTGANGKSSPMKKNAARSKKEHERGFMESGSRSWDYIVEGTVMFLYRVAKSFLLVIVMGLGFIPYGNLHRGGMHFLFKSETGSVYNTIGPYWHLSSGYGLFRRMTGTGPMSNRLSKKKAGWAMLDHTPTPKVPVLVLEARDPTTEKWSEIPWRYHPGPLDRMPIRIAPFQPRFDWQLWFAALRDNWQQSNHNWLIRMIWQLLRNDPSSFDALELLPREVDVENFDAYKIKLYHYDFTRYNMPWNSKQHHAILDAKGVDSSESKSSRTNDKSVTSTKNSNEATGLVSIANWWSREYIKDWLPPVNMQSLDPISGELKWLKKRQPKNPVLLWIREAFLLKSKIMINDYGRIFSTEIIGTHHNVVDENFVLVIAIPSVLAVIFMWI